MATALPLPSLDDRRWADLVDEGRALIPFYAPEWTDHNAHDPGITLIDLFAWIAEMDIYAVNRITDAQRLKFLALAGIVPQPPQPAETLLALRLADGFPPQPIPAGLEFEGSDPTGVPVQFRARHELTVQPGRIAAVFTSDGTTLEDQTAAWARGEPVQPFGVDPQPGAALYLGFAMPAPWPAESEVSLGIALDPADRAGRAERDRIAEELAGRVADCAPPWDAIDCGRTALSDDDDGHPNEDVRPPRLAHHAVQVIWEITTGPETWTRLYPETGVRDQTRALTLDGRVIVRTPGPVATSTLGGRADALTWLRVRLVRGAYDAAPVLRGLALNAVEAVQAVPATARLQIAPGAHVVGTPPAPGAWTGVDFTVDSRGDVTYLAFVAPSAGTPRVRLLLYEPATRILTIEAAAVAWGSGAPSQRIEIANAPVVKNSVHLASLEGGSWRTWTIRPDFDASGRADAHARLDSSAGALTLGDGERGRAAAPGSALLVSADITRAAEGNLPARTINRLASSAHNEATVPGLTELTAALGEITNVTPAIGGAAAETLPATIARAREGRERALRAVTLDDVVVRALETPGTRLARAEARANFHPGFPCLKAPGIVTVLILPHLPADHPEPTPGLRQVVAAYLNRGRVIGTRVEVAGPLYVTVAVRATVEACPGARAAEVQTAIGETLDRFFHPLTGGQDGTGWPFGRDVYRTEVLGVIDEVPGVAHVLALELLKDGCPTCGNVCLGPTGLVDAGPHEIDVR